MRSLHIKLNVQDCETTIRFDDDWSTRIECTMEAVPEDTAKGRKVSFSQDDEGSKGVETKQEITVEETKERTDGDEVGSAPSSPIQSPKSSPNSPKSPKSSNKKKKKRKTRLRKKKEKKINIFEGKYEGSFVENVREGSGTLTYVNGDMYDGDFLDGFRHGKGTLRCQNGKYSYVGEWKRSLKDGEGKEHFPNGSKYLGKFSKDKFHGFGKLYTSSGVYEGLFENGVKNGRGKFTWFRGDTYDGNWRNGFMDGYGVYTSAKAGTMYTGNFLKGTRHGKGNEVNEAGEKYSGHWERNKKHGEGNFRWANGKWRSGVWDQDKHIRWRTGDRLGGMPSV